jgi:site-specific recombinase XerD
VPAAAPPLLTLVSPQALRPPCDIATQQALVTAWLLDLDQRVAMGQRAALTRDVYGRAIRPWLHFLAQVVRTDRPDPTTVDRFLAWSRERGRAPSSINHQLATLGTCYRFAERTGRYPHIARAAERLREHRDAPLPCLDHDQIQALRERARGTVVAAEGVWTQTGRDVDARRLLAARRNLAMLSVLYGTGVRVVSLHRANCGDWQAELGEWRHRPKGHLASDAVAYVASTVAADLEGYLTARRSCAADQPLFSSHAPSSAGHRLTVRMISRIILDQLSAAGHVERWPDGRVVHPRRLSAHSIRRSAAKRIVECHDLELARQLLGHASLETTRRAYARTQRAEDLRRAAGDLG